MGEGTELMEQRGEIVMMSPADPEQVKAMMVLESEKHLGALSPSRYPHTLMLAQLYAGSSLVPQHFQKKESDCVLVLDLAERLNMDAFALFQNMSIVKGKPCYEGKLVIALIHRNGPFAKPLEFVFDGSGKTLACTCIGTYADKSRVEMTISMKLVEANGWLSNPKWTSMPEQMLRYRSASWLARAYCPGVLMGMYSQDEAGEIDAIDVPATVISEPTTRPAPKAKSKGRRKAKPETEAPSPAPIEDPTEPPEIEAPPEEPPLRVPLGEQLAVKLAEAGIDAGQAADYFRHIKWLKGATSTVMNLEPVKMQATLERFDTFVVEFEKFRTGAAK